MQKNKSFLCFSEAQQNKNDNLGISNTGVTRRLLEKYKSKKDYIVKVRSQEEKEGNIAA